MIKRTELVNYRCKALNCQTFAEDGLACTICNDGVPEINGGLGYYLNTTGDNSTCLQQHAVDNCVTYASNVD